jgi:hypothetical protein
MAMILKSGTTHAESVAILHLLMIPIPIPMPGFVQTAKDK